MTVCFFSMPTALRTAFMLCVVVVLPNCLAMRLLLRGSSDALPGALRQPFDRFYRCDAARIGSIASARFEPVLK